MRPQHVSVRSLHRHQHPSGQSLSPGLLTSASEGARPRTYKSPFTVVLGAVLMELHHHHHPQGEISPQTPSLSCCEVLGGQVEDVALHGRLPLAPVPLDLSLDLKRQHGLVLAPGAPPSLCRGVGAAPQSRVESECKKEGTLCLSVCPCAHTGTAAHM